MNPDISVIIPLAEHRGRAAECLASWSTLQTLTDERRDVARFERRRDADGVGQQQPDRGRRHDGRQRADDHTDPHDTVHTVAGLNRGIVRRH